MLRELLMTSRPVSWVNTAYPFGAAYLLGGGGVDWKFGLGALFFLIPYNLLMYGVNDVFDYESDVRNPRKGGVEGALLARESHMLVLRWCVIVSVPFVLVLALAGSVASNVVLFISLAAVLAYSAPTLRFKERPGLDSVTSATHFVSPALYGWVLSGSPLGATQWLVFAAFLLWGIASHALGAIQDIIPDREAGLGSIATVGSARTTVYLVLGSYAMAGILIYASLDGLSALSALLAIPYILNVLPHLGVTDETSGEVNRAWKRFLWINYVCGFLLTMLIIAVLWTA